MPPSPDNFNDERKSHRRIAAESMRRTYIYRAAPSVTFELNTDRINSGLSDLTNYQNNVDLPQASSIIPAMKNTSFNNRTNQPQPGMTGEMPQTMHQPTRRMYFEPAPSCPNLKQSPSKDQRVQQMTFQPALTQPNFYQPQQVYQQDTVPQSSLLPDSALDIQHGYVTANQQLGAQNEGHFLNKIPSPQEAWPTSGTMSVNQIAWEDLASPQQSNPSLAEPPSHLSSPQVISFNSPQAPKTDWAFKQDGPWSDTSPNDHDFCPSIFPIGKPNDPPSNSDALQNFEESMILDRHTAEAIGPQGYWQPATMNTECMSARTLCENVPWDSKDSAPSAIDTHILQPQPSQHIEDWLTECTAENPLPVWMDTNDDMNTIAIPKQHTNQDMGSQTSFFPFDGAFNNKINFVLNEREEVLVNQTGGALGEIPQNDNNTGLPVCDHCTQSQWSCFKDVSSTEQCDNCWVFDEPCVYSLNVDRATPHLEQSLPTRKESQLSPRQCFHCAQCKRNCNREETYPDQCDTCRQWRMQCYYPGEHSPEILDPSRVTFVAKGHRAVSVLMEFIGPHRGPSISI